MRRTIPLALLLLAACTSSAPAEPGRSVPSETPQKPGEAPADPPADPRTALSCPDQITAYLDERKRLNHCETDSDCSEMWPGLCPAGPYYIHRDADISEVLGREITIMQTCSTPECEPPMELGIAQCDAGVCKRGRMSAEAEAKASRKGGIKHMSCWDYRETWFEQKGGASAVAASTITGVTSHVAIAPGTAGRLVIDIDWPLACKECRLLISEHNSGMARLITGKATSTEAKRNGDLVRREHIEVPVTPGPYHMVGMADADTDFVLYVELLDADGKPGKVTRHGVGWQRMCEG